MHKVETQVAKVKKERRIGLMTHVVVGYPSLAATGRLVRAMAEAGADFIELQIPFSDPLADGPTIMKACEAAIAKGTRTRDAIALMQKLSRTVPVPLLFMAYYNTVYKYGVQKFCRDAARAGASGIIVPDMPIEEEGEEHLFRFAKQYGLANIRVISRVSTPRRMQLNARVGQGFVYCTARQGITGARKAIDPALRTFLMRARRSFKIPLAVGFGISKKAQVRAIAPYADVAVIGSALIDVINASRLAERERNVKRFIRSLVRN